MSLFMVDFKICSRYSVFIEAENILKGTSIDPGLASNIKFLKTAIPAFALT